jgi:hypothetical protein
MKPAPQAGCVSKVIAASTFQMRGMFTGSLSVKLALSTGPVAIEAQPEVEGKDERAKAAGEGFKFSLRFARRVPLMAFRRLSGACVYAVALARVDPCATDKPANYDDTD